MENLPFRVYKENCRERLDQAGERPRFLVMIYAGVLTGVSLVSTLITWWLEKQIADTGGLAGMGSRANLQAIQFLVSVLPAVLSIFWEMGYVSVALGFARGKAMDQRNLLDGFHSWGRVLRLTLIKGAISMGVMMVCLYGSIFVFMITPLSSGMYDLLAPYMMSQTVTIPEELVYQMMGEMVPALVIFAVLYVVAMVAVFYPLRLADFVMMDESRCGARASMRASRFLMRGKTMYLLRLDLSLWWYYLLQVLAGLVAYGDVVLASVGVTLPMSAEAASILFIVLGLGAQFALYVFGKNYVLGTYAQFYLSRMIQLEPNPQ